ncbi:Ig-like domain-containing protein [Paenibacillus septentrionalis]|uniref:Ig-like domain-containing protein n=1 Tax=Paenibacillus septentrionalis TaxID=429342 RepID=A0ABW1V716_9BACL
MMTKIRNKTKAIFAVLLSSILVLASLTPLVGGGSVYADSATYVPPINASPSYTGPLTWTNHTVPGTISLDFSIPFFIDMDKEDQVYVTKSSTGFGSSNGPTGKVERVSKDGSTSEDLSFNQVEFHNPLGIAVDDGGNVYVSDNSSFRLGANLGGSNSSNVAKIYKLDAKTQKWDDITEGKVMQSVLGIAVDRHGSVYAVDSVYKTQSGGSSTVHIWKLTAGSHSWVELPGVASTLSNPLDIAVDGEGNVFVTDIPVGSSGTKIYKLSVGTNTWTNVTPPSSGSTSFVTFGLHVDRFDNVIAADLHPLNLRVLKLPYGKGADGWETIQVTSTPSMFDVASDSSGYLYGTSSSSLNVVRLMATVTYYGNGHSPGGTVPIDPTGYKAGETAIVLGNTGNLVKTDYHFVGWNTKADGTGTSYAPGDGIHMTENAELYAVWSDQPPVPTFTVVYEAGTNGTISGSGSETVVSGSFPVSVPMVTPHDGYTFVGWSSDGGATLLSNEEVASTVVTDTITYTAYYQERVTLESLNLDQTSYSLAIGESHQTIVTAVYSDDTSEQVLSSEVTFSSSDTTVATVDGTGLVSAIKSGTTVIKAAYEGKEAEATVTVPATLPDPVTLESLKLDQTSYSLAIGETHQTIVTAIYSDATSEQVLPSEVTFSSSDTAVATVDGTGLVSAIKSGTTVIKAAYEGKEVEATVTVPAALPDPVTLERLNLDQTSYSLAIGESHQTIVTAVYSDDTSEQVLPSEVTFSSSDTAVATVDGTGLVTAIKSGTTVIKAAYEGKEAEATVTVSAALPDPVTLERLNLDQTSYSLTIGATHQTIVTAVYSDDTSEQVLSSEVTFSSSDTTVATVDDTGLVRAIKSGTTVIKAAYEGKEAEATVTVPTVIINNPSTSSDNANPGVKIIVDGVEQEQLATAERDTVNGHTVTKILLDSQKVIDKLKRDNNKLLTIPVTGDSQVVVGQLNGSLVKSMKASDTEIRIVTDRAVYMLPAAQIDIDGISAQLGANQKLEDIIIQIEIREASEEKAAQVQAAAKTNGFEAVVHPVDFEISAYYGSQSLQANKFNSYVARMIALPDGLDLANITTGVVLTDGGELHHVPTVVIRQDGKTYAVINSLTNSTYSIIYNPSEMSDTAGHWANAEVNDMVSRLILNGVLPTEFRPDESITRAEFAAIVMRALGIQGVEYADAFLDVTADDWYAEAVQTAFDYHLISGHNDGSFRPNAQISRQEAVVVLYRAAAIAKLKTALSDAEVEILLSAFADGAEAANWARLNLAEAIDLGLIQGRGNKLDVSANLTRAEAAVLIRRMLQAANLINS